MADIDTLTRQARDIQIKNTPEAVHIYTQLTGAYLRHYLQDRQANSDSLLRAQAVALKATQPRPEAVLPRGQLARQLKESGEDEQAVHHAHIALRLEPGNPEATKLLADLGAPIEPPLSLPEAQANGADLNKVVTITAVILIGIVAVGIFVAALAVVLLIKLISKKKKTA